MFKTRHTAIMAAILLSICLSACATTVGNKTDIRDIKFEIGKTHKSEVAKVLGFPAAMEKDPKTGCEMWGYHEKPELAGLYYALPTGATTVTTYDVTYYSNRREQFKEAALICIFDKNDLLADLHYPKRERK